MSQCAVWTKEIASYYLETLQVYTSKENITIDKHYLGKYTLTFLDKMLDFIQPLGLSQGSHTGEKETINEYVKDYFQEKVKERKVESPILNFMLHPSNGRLMRS